MSQYPVSRPRFIVDDWGVSPEINQSVVDLAKRNLIYGVSILAEGPVATFLLNELLAIKNLKIGMHLNFTQKDLTTGYWYFSKIAQMAFSPSRAAQEIERQYDSLLDMTGRVDYIDGHHHAHLYPLIRRQVFKFANKNSIPVRMIRDRSHICSSLLSYSLRPPEKSFFCYYLPPSLIERSQFTKHINKCSDDEDIVVVHTACPSKVRAGDAIFDHRIAMHQWICDSYG